MFQRNVLATKPTAASTKILNVSSDKLLADIRQAVLKRMGYTVIAAENATEAMVKLASQTFDLLILCHTLPNRERRLLASESKAKQIPVLSFTDSDVVNKSQVSTLVDAACFVAKVRELAHPNRFIPKPGHAIPN